MEVVAKKTSKKKEKFIPDFKDWRDFLSYDDEGKLYQTPANAMKILKHDERLKDKFSYDLTINTVFKTKGLPWSQKDDKYTNADRKIMSDFDFKALYNYFHNNYNFSHITVIDNAFAEFCLSIQHNPLIDYLDSLPQWDGVPRVDTLLIDYFNAEDTGYVRIVTRKKLTALLKRAYEPGCKFDECLILKGGQGLGKSTFFRILGGDWFTDKINITSDSAKTYESIKGKWVCEMGELVSLKKSEAELIKSHLSAQYDSYRPPYGKNVMQIPRMGITVGTTNSDEFLKDVTGNRRFWTVKVFTGGVKNVWNDLPIERDQILAEAKMIYKSGEPLHLPKEIEEIAALIQSEFVIRDGWADTIENYLEIILPSNWRMMKDFERVSYIDQNRNLICGSNKRQSVTIEEIWIECLGSRIENLTPTKTNQIRDIMNQVEGWKAFKNARNTIFGRKRGWERIKK
ncbi:VapE domain-containing protein [Pelosinus sp. sgz500959]|uniref:VapE domain-containing protein n=1 Tax=Pelosinus sp. sgz500959 TaxID=3242472 RepID=UPI0036704953